MNVFGKRTFLIDDQILFAELSGDWNPIHIDPIASRRTPFGQIAHGVHVVLWMLDCYLSSRACGGFSRLRVSFFRPIRMNETVECFSQQDGSDVVLFLQRRGTTYVSVRITPGPRHSTEASVVGLGQYSQVPEELNFEQLADAKGELTFGGERSRFVQSFPALIEVLGLHNIQLLCALSRLVGMKVPGLHSLFAGFSVTFSDTHSNTLHYEVSRHSSSVAPIRIQFQSGGTSGCVEAFFRPGPVVQSTLSEICSRVIPGEFADKTALIVGASRGLGEVTSKIVAAGSGTTILTYKVGQEDVAAIAQDIRKIGQNCVTMQLDVLSRDVGTLEFPFLKTDELWIFYFASPPITVNTGEFDLNLFESFVAFYIQGLSGLVERLPKSCRAKIFIPSTIYLDTPSPDFMEYVAAKAACEEFCRAYASKNKNVSFLVQRLPPMRTDQTNGVMPKKMADPIEVILNVVRRMHSSE